jgi:uncharacterized DUF497 family protein
MRAVQFEWNKRKALENVVTHGVSFELATEVFDDPRVVLAEDAAHSRSERRYFAFGRVSGGVLTVRFSIRGERVRIIGAGYWRKGKAFYEQANRVQR